jgi:penicillin-binding protein 1A
MDAPRERLTVTSDETAVPDAAGIAPAPRQRPRRRQSRILSIIRGIFALVFAMGAVGAGAAALIGWNIYSRYTADLPALDGLRAYQPPVMSRIYAGDDRLMAELAAERRIFVPYTAIPEKVRQAFIAAEDKNFYTHHGIDPFAIARAAMTDLQRVGESRRPVGASTITQQVARNMLLNSNAVSFERKIKEALLAMRIEHALTKQRILELYLNEIYLGQGAFGVAAAAQTYFNKPLDQLTIGEAAMLGALPKSPSNYNPFRAPEAARNRRDWVIDRMVETGAITAAAAAAAHAEPLVPHAYHRPDLVPGADWFAEEVRRRLLERFGQDATTEGGLIVHTSLDSTMQQKADEALRRGLLAYDRSHGGWRGPVGHLVSNIALQGDWQDALGRTARPPGMPTDWQLAVVIEDDGTEAKLGVLPAPGSDGPGTDGTPHLAALSLSGLGWARHVEANGDVGASPRRLADVVVPGDVIMVEPKADASPLSIRHGRGRHATEERLDQVVLRQIPKVSGALVAMDPHSGRVLAMSGGWSAEASKFNRATQAQRQPGSSFKPFVYLTAMEQGISPSARFLDAPFALGDWRPNNYEMNFGGPTPLDVALEQSLNLVTVRVAQRVGMDAIAKTAIGYHLYDSMPKVLPASLGAVETTVLREAGAYASIAEGGRVVVPSLIDSVQDRDGHTIWRPSGLAFGAGDPAQPPVLTDTRPQLADPASAYQILKMMEDVVLHGTGEPVGAGLDRPIAGKTGTSQDFNDAWFAGFTPDLVTVVWIGFDTPQTLGDKQTGAVAAGPIWHNFVASVEGDKPALDFPQPPGVELYRWGCSAHECIDAFKPDQVPGAAGVAGEDADPGSNIQVFDADSGDMQGDQSQHASAPPGAAAGTGVDSGVGGLY